MEMQLLSAYDFGGLAAIYTAAADQLEASAADLGLSGPRDLSPGQWSNRMRMLSRSVFAGPGLLRSGRAWLDRERVVSIYREVYRPLCLEYGQIVKLEDFCAMLGVSRQCIYKWSDIPYMGSYRDIGRKEKNGIDIDIYPDGGGPETGGNATLESVNLSEEINADNESCLASLMIADRGNPLRYLSVLNRRHGWNSSSGPERAEKPLSIAEIRQSLGLLSASDGQAAEKSDKPHKIQQNKRKVSEK